MNKFIPPVLLLLAGIYFWLQPRFGISESSSVPSEILTTWRTGTAHRKLTLYQDGTSDMVDGYFYNAKLGKLEGIVKSSYSDGTLTGIWFQAKNTNRCTSKKYGTFYWGKFELNISKTSFKGKWAYCDNELGGSWNGRND